MDPQTVIYTCPLDHYGNGTFVKGYLATEKHGPPFLIVQEYGQNPAKMQVIAQEISRHGHNAYTFDMYQNRNKDRRQIISSVLEGYTLDILQVSSWVRHKENGNSPVLFSFGSGALVSLMFLGSHGRFCQGLVCSAPLFLLQEPLARSHYLLLQFIADFLPELVLPAFLAPRLFYTSKGRKSRGIKAKVGFEFMAATARSRKLFLKQQNTPCLLLFPKNDPICRYEPFRKSSKQLDGVEFLDLDFKRQEMIFPSKEMFINEMLEPILSWVENSLESDLNLPKSA